MLTHHNFLRTHKNFNPQNRFLELARLVEPDAPEPRTDKLSILGEAIRFVASAAAERHQLRTLNKFLEQRVAGLERERAQAMYVQAHAAAAQAHPHHPHAHAPHHPGAMAPPPPHAAMAAAMGAPPPQQYGGGGAYGAPMPPAPPHPMHPMHHAPAHAPYAPAHPHAHPHLPVAPSVAAGGKPEACAAQQPPVQQHAQGLLPDSAAHDSLLRPPAA